VLQMTRFKCGGITLACNWAHPVADGFSGFHFMKSWAELARGEELSLLPVHDRALLKPRKPLILSDPFAGGHPEFASREESLKEAEGGEIAPVVQVVEITKQDVDEMKREVESGGEPGEEGVRLSRVCYVSAYLWRALVRARGLPGADLTRFWILVEGRKKMALPAGYFGNAIGGRYATTTVSSLLEKPLAYSASLVHATIQHCTKEWYQDLVDWVEAEQEGEHPGLVLGADHECGSSWQNRFPYYELDFGFGAPVCSMRNANAAWDGLFVFLPSSQSPENFTAMLHATPDVMKRFLPFLHSFS
jgi:shikimate O-hydroxycinnamoyltransferase